MLVAREGAPTGGEGVLSSRACLTTPAVRSRKTASMSGWFRTTSILINPSGVPIVNFSACLPTEAALSIPKICPPALCTTWPYLLSASARLVMSVNLPIFLDGRAAPRKHTPEIPLFEYPGRQPRVLRPSRNEGSGLPLGRSLSSSASGAHVASRRPRWPRACRDWRSATTANRSRAAWLPPAVW